MKVILSFDVEVWCNGWTCLDEDFPSAFTRYVYGHSRINGGALPRTLDILARYGIKGVFFVEPLFSARFGSSYLREIIDLIGSRGHQIELHLHSEWADEIRPRPLPHITTKRQHLQQLSFEDQLTLIRTGLALLRDAGVSGISAFRAGSFGANADTLRAVGAAGLAVDSSINAATSISVPDLRDSVDLYQPSRIGEILSVPMTVFRDGFGRIRPAQVGSCSFSELRQIIDQAVRERWPIVNILSHNFELLRQNSARIDPFVLRRFERLCAYIEAQKDTLMPQGDPLRSIALPSRPLPVPRASFGATAARYVEQLARRTLPA